MKKFMLFCLLFTFLTSCDYVLKKKEINTMVKIDSVPELGIAIEKDKNGCIKEAGYKWSIIKDNCIRISDEGYRLNPIDDLGNLEPSKSAYVLLNDDKLKAEVFLQDLPKSIYFSRKSKSEDFLKNNYKLSIQTGYTLSVNDSIIYRAAETAIKAVVGSDVEEK
ncbi:hypothetical protein [uncultured Flavobacterium sp.]|uniref:hypothetical protein n=1 Tax=uncultured Flavobacterium sp. TaxID=165435 RepID=UPI0030EE44F7